MICCPAVCLLLHRGLCRPIDITGICLLHLFVYFIPIRPDFSFQSNDISIRLLELTVVWRSGSALISINAVNLRRTRLVLGWVTVSELNSLCADLARHVTSHPGQLSLVITSWVGAMSTSQRAMTPCDCGVKAGIVGVWWQVKLCDHLVTHGPYLSALAL